MCSHVCNSCFHLVFSYICAWLCFSSFFPLATGGDCYPFSLLTACSGVFTQEISAEERKKLQKRKHLADKLKEEVIKK